LRLGGTPAPFAVGVMTAAFGAGQIAGRGGGPPRRQLRAAVLWRPRGSADGVSRLHSGGG
jgi:hypothetical protein